jgi:hypothetical protein
VSACASSCTSASGPCFVASTRSSASVIEWSPPTPAGKIACVDDRRERLLDLR